ncbi:hypothetical protein V8G54_011381, partial [Vigna mungo]
NFQFLTSLLDPKISKSIIPLIFPPFPKSKVAFLFPKIFQTLVFSAFPKLKVFVFPLQLSTCSSHHHFQVSLGRSLCVDRQFSVFIVAVAVTVVVALTVASSVAVAMESSVAVVVIAHHR